MLGILLLIIAFFFYFKPRFRHYSYLIYLSFMMGYGGGFGLTTDAVLGVKNTDMAIIYTFVISVYLLVNGKYRIPNKTLRKWFIVFSLFMGCSVLFSIIYYGFTPFQVLQGGRSFLLIYSFPILIRITAHELTFLLRWLLGITIVTAFLYIMQIVIGRPLMPYSGEPNIDSTVGLIRMYNSPPLLDFFLALSFVIPAYFGRYVNLLRLLLVIALVCTLGRTGIFTTLITVVLSVMFTEKITKAIKVTFVLGILMLPFMGLLTERFEEGGTDEDLEEILNNGYVNFERSGSATMTYRIAWVYERFAYLKDRPLGEQIFGMGLISESQPVVSKMYRFNVGNIVEETGLPNQLYTPDISYGPIITRLGFVGGIIYIGFSIALVVFICRNRKVNSLATVCAAMGIMLFIASFAGNTLAETKNFAMYFLTIGTLLARKYGFSLHGKDKLLFTPLSNKIL